MSLRNLRPEVDASAWFASDTWLSDQLTLDFSEIMRVLDRFVDDPDSPLSDSRYSSIIGAFEQALDDIGSLPLSGCDPIIATGSNMSKIRCEWGVEPMTLYSEIRLISVGDERYAVNILSMNEKRMRHFSAIANSFVQKPI